MQRQFSSKKKFSNPNIVYKAKVKTQENHQINYGTLEGEFKI